MYRGSPGLPAVSAHFTKRNGGLCTDALTRWYNPFTARPRRWISHEGAGVLHRIEGHLDDLQYQHILQNVMVASVRTL